MTTNQTNLLAPHGYWVKYYETFRFRKSLQVYILFIQYPPTNPQIRTKSILAQTSSDTVAYSPLDSGVIVESGKVTI